ncbi:MAG: hypothetical protein ACXWEA_06240 [Solirubrobacterales bacterium]
MPQTPRRLALASTCLIAALGLIACGGGGDDEGTTSTTGLGSGASTATSATDTAATGTNGATGASTTAATDDAVSEVFFSTIHKTVLNKGLSEQAAQCIEDKLRDSITTEEIDQIKSGQKPESLRAKATEAGSECGQKFGG